MDWHGDFRAFLDEVVGAAANLGECEIGAAMSSCAVTRGARIMLARRRAKRCRR